MKRHLIRYQSFEEAREDTIQQFIINGFDARVAVEFFKGCKSDAHFKPCLLRFKSFDEAREYDMKNLILKSVGRLK